MSLENLEIGMRGEGLSHPVVEAGGRRAESAELGDPVRGRLTRWLCGSESLSSLLNSATLESEAATR